MPLDPADYIPPDDPNDWDTWLAAHEERIATQYATTIARLVKQHANRYATALVATGDPSLLDGVTAQMERAAQRAADDIAELRMSGAVAAWIRRRRNGQPPADVQQIWADVVNQNAVEYGENLRNMIRGATQSVWQTVKNRVVSTLKDGSDVRTLRKEVAQITGYATHRAEAIARTEVMDSFNGGVEDAANALPDDWKPVAKQWLATSDSRTRDSHKDADGQMVAWDDEFSVGGHRMRRPGDRRAPADEVINCRCTLLVFYPDDPDLPDEFRTEEPEAPTQVRLPNGKQIDIVTVSPEDGSYSEGWNPRMREITPQIESGLNKVQDRWPNAPTPGKLIYDDDSKALANAGGGDIRYSHAVTDAEFWERRQKERWLFAAGDDHYGIESVTVHENGHIMHQQMRHLDPKLDDELWNFVTGNHEYEMNGTKVVARRYEAGDPDLGHPSTYATESPYEYVAEAITDVLYNGDDARKSSKLVAEFFDKLYS